VCFNIKVNLQNQNAGILVLFLAMMFLAPAPFAAVLQSSDKEMKPLHDRRGSLASVGSIDVGDPSSMSTPFNMTSIPIDQVEEKGEEEEEGEDDVETDRASALQMAEVRSSVLSRRSLWKRKSLSKQTLETRMASRSLVINLAVSFF
jgi:hypothetical protein